MRYPRTPIHCRPWLLNGKPIDTKESLARNFGSVERDEFVVMASSLAGGSGRVLLTYIPRDRRLVNQTAWKAIGGATKLYA